MSTEKSNAGKGGGVGSDAPRIVVDGTASSAINGGGGGDLLFGGAGNDTINGNGGNDWISGGAGNDTGIHDLRTDAKGWDFMFGGQGNDTLEVRLSAAQLQDPKIRAELIQLKQFVAENKGEAVGNDYDHIGTFNSLGLKVAGWENLRVTVDDKPYNLDDLTKPGNGNGNGGGNGGNGSGGGDGSGSEPEPVTVTLATPDKNVNTTSVVSQWAEQGVFVRALVGEATNPTTWQETSLGTKTVSFTINSSNTTDKSLYGNYQYSGLGIKSPNGIDGGEIDTISGGTNPTTELMAVSFEKPMESVTLQLSSLFDGKDDPNIAGADRGPYDLGYVEKAQVVVYGTEGQVLGTVQVTGTINGLASVTLSAATFGNAIGSVAIAPVSDGAGRSGNNSDFLLRSVTATPSTTDQTASTPTLLVQTASGLEDQAIALNVSAALTDKDGSETLSVTISGVPTGATLSSGVKGPDGVWTLKASDLPGLTLTPPADYSGSITLNVTAVATESNGGAKAVTAAATTVTVNAVADAPTLSAGAVSGAEDSAIALNLSSALKDADGSETLSVTLTGVPSGATLSAGTKNADGSWTLSGTQLSGLTLTPPANYSGNLTLSVSATSREANGSTATTSGSMTVSVAGVADAPAVTVANASGTEDGAVALNIGAALTDTDGSETLSVTLTGLPSGATLSAGTKNADGSWTLSGPQLNGLTLTPPAGFSGQIALGVTVTSGEAGGSTTTTAGLTVSVTGVADAPTLHAGDVAGLEDQPVALDLSAALTDTDGSETLSVTLTGVPEGAVLSAGTRNADGSWTLSGDQLSGLTLTPPKDFNGAIELGVTATSREANGSTATTTGTATVSLSAVADGAELDLENASGMEDQPIALDLGAAVPSDGGSESLSITIGGVPDGATLSAGTKNADGTWTLSADDLDGLTLTPPADFSGVLSLTVSATTTEANGDQATTTGAVTVTVGGVADAPDLAVSDMDGAEDETIALDIGAALTDTDGSETLSVTVEGVPDGATLSAGTKNADGTWTLSADDLDGLTLTPPAGYAGNLELTVTATSTDRGGATSSSTAVMTVSVAAQADAPELTVSDATGTEDHVVHLTVSSALTDLDGSETLTITISDVPDGVEFLSGVKNDDGSWTLSAEDLSGLAFIPPKDFSGQITMTVTAIATESSGAQSVRSESFTTVITPITDAPVLTVENAAGTEDGAITLDLSAALTDLDGSETLTVVIGNLPEGSTLSAGVKNADGTWTLQPDELQGVTFTPPAGFSGEANLSVSARSTEWRGDTADTTATLTVSVAAVADAPVLSVGNVSGAEDSAIALDLSATLTDTDGSETLSVTIGGVPDGATLSAGTKNTDGSWTLSAADLDGLTITPPANASGDIALTVTATSREANGSTATTSAALTVSVAAVADAPALAVSDVAGNEDGAIALDLSAALSDTDGSETLSVTIGGVPDGATLSAGTKNADGSWTLSATDLDGLTVTPPAGFDGEMALSVTATTSEANGSTATTTAEFTVSVAAIADAPVLSVDDAAGAEDGAIALDLSAALTDTDGSETLSITIGGVPDGATLSAGTKNADGSWTLSATDLDGLTITPPADASGDIALTVTATGREANGSTATTTAALTVSVAAVADIPTLAVEDAGGAEDSAIALDLSAALGDTDGSETLSVTIGGVPDGATLSGGTKNADGTWTLSAADLDGLTITPPANASGDIALTVTATSRESNGSTATTTAALTVAVAAVADAASLTADDVTGTEDAAIALDLSAALTDTDGSETLSITVSGVPDGASLSAGTKNADGSWTLSASDLDGLTVTPPAGFGGEMALSITATTSEANGSTATTTAAFTVSVAAVADAPVLAVDDAAGVEDSAIALDLSAALTDTDGSETLSVTIGGVPDGATLSAGTKNADGSWTLTAADLNGVTITPPANASGDIALTVTATSREANGSTATTSAALTVSVAAVADTPSLAVSDVAGSEDSAIALDLSAALGDTDGSETLSVTIGGVPAGATLSAGTKNADGSWTLSAADLDGLTVTPPANASGDIALTVTATSREANGSTATTSAALTVSVAAVADAPVLAVSNATGTEDTAVPLNLSATIVDESETLSMTLTGVPEGATLSAGTKNADGSWTLTSDQLDGLTLTPPSDFSGDIVLSVEATNREANGSTATTTASLTVSIAAVADAPVLAADDAAGSEDGVIALDLSAALGDTDGSETLSVTIGGVPDGASLSAGIKNADGSWTLSATDLDGLTITPPANASGDMALTVTATSREANGSTATTSAALTVSVAAVADAPSLTVSDVAGSEDGTIALDLSAALSDTDGSETLSVTIGGVPDGATLSAGTKNADGSWTLSAADVDGLTVTPAADFTGEMALSVTATTSEANGSTATSTAAFTVSVAAVADAPVLSVEDASGAEDSAISLDLSAALTDTDGSETLSVTIGGVPDGATLSAGTKNADGSWTLTATDLDGLTLSPPADASGEISLTVTATSREANGSTATTSAALTVSVAAVADAPSLAASDAAGAEDTAIALDLSAALTDTDGSETLSVTIGGVPDGATLSAGTKNADGSWTLSAADLDGLTLTPPANASGDIALTVTATSREANGSTATTSAALTVSVAAVADAPVLAVSNAAGTEDAAIALDLSAALNDTDGSETLAITIGGVPDGATLSAGTKNADGTWTLSAADLDGLTITPPADASGDFSLTVTAIAKEAGGETASSTATVTVSVAAAADAPVLSASDTVGNEDAAIPLDISAALTDGSETLSVTIGGVPDGATLSAGTKNADGSWTLTAADLDGLTITPPANASGDIALTVTATSREPNGSTATTTAALTVSVAAVADTPTLAVEDAGGAEDSAIALDLSAALGDTDGSETLSVTIGGLPDGATLSAGTKNADGSWTLSAADLDGLTITPPANASGDIPLTVTATSREANGSTATTTAALTVAVAAVADAASLTADDVTGTEDAAIALDLSAALTDTDGSETLSITVSGVPDGASLSAGTKNADGSWTLSASDLDGLTVTPPAGFGGEMALSITATTSEANGPTATTTAAFTVSVAAVADAPVLAVDDAAGVEDSAIALDLSAALTDTDGSETLSVTIGGVPDGASLSAGTKNADGSWTLSATDLDGLTITPPANASGDIALTVTATSREANGSTATTTAALTVSVAAVADAPSLAVSDVDGSEDSAIALDLSAALGDTDGSETLSVTIGGVPDGATLSAGTKNADGSWTLSAADLDGLTVTPAADFTGEMALSVAATTSEANGSTATSTAAFTVSVAAVADAPVLSVEDASGAEDSAIALDLSAALTDTDGSETLSVTIGGVPDGATLSAGTKNADGTWTLSAADLDGLTITPPADASGDIALTVTATSRETNGSTATTSAALTVSVAAVADAPTLAVEDVTGAEDSAIALDLSAMLTDTDGSETLSVTIGGVPDGAMLSAGTKNADGSWTLSAADLDGLTITPPADANGDIPLTVTATSREANGDTAVTSAALTVSVAAVADAPTLEVFDATGFEDGAIVLDISTALKDTDGSETLSIKVAGVPQGATLSAGTRNSDGSWTLTAAQVEGLTLTAPTDFSGRIDLTVTATGREADGDTAETTATLSVDVTPVADAPVLTVSNASGIEDALIALDLLATLSDTDGSETLSVTVTGVPEGASLSAGTRNADGSWTLGAADLQNLSLTPPANASGDIQLMVAATTVEIDGSTATTRAAVTVSVMGKADAPTLAVTSTTGAEDEAIALPISAALTDTDGSETLTITVAGIPTGATLSSGTRSNDGIWTLTPTQATGVTMTPPTNFSGKLEITITATATEATGETAVRSETVTVTVTPVADDPDLTTTDGAGDEDSDIALNLSAALTDTDGSETLSITITGLPSGATLSAGTRNADGSWTVDPDDLDGLTLTPPANFSGELTLGVTATSRDTDGATSSRTASLTVSVAAVADAPVLETVDAGGDEDSAIALDIDSQLADTDGSETLSVTIGGVPTGATLSAGTRNADGTWTLTSAQLSGLTITPPADFSGEIALTISAVSKEQNGSLASQTAELIVTVAPVADAPTLSVADVSGEEDTPIALDIAAALTDTDGSETLSVTITGVPVGAVLSAGTRNDDGTWTVEAGDLDGLTLTPPQNFEGDITLSLVANSLESDGSTASTAAATMTVTVIPVDDTPTLNVQPATGAEDSAIALSIVAAPPEGITVPAVVTLIGLPAGTVLSDGTHSLIADGMVAADLSGWTLSELKLTAPENFSGEIDLTVSASFTLADGTTTTTTAPLAVTVTPVADAPLLTVADAITGIGAPVRLNFTALLQDLDGSETMGVKLAGIPAGTKLSFADGSGDIPVAANGEVTFSASALADAMTKGVMLTPPTDRTEGFDITVQATSHDGDNATAQTSATLHVDIVEGPSRIVVSNAVTATGQQDRSDSYKLPYLGTNSQRTVTGETLDIAGVSATSSVSVARDAADNPTIVADKGFGTVRNVYVEGVGGQTITTRKFVSSDVVLAGAGDSTVVIADGLGGTVQSGDGADRIEFTSVTAGVAGTNNTGTLKVSSGAGNDTVLLTAQAGVLVSGMIDAGAGDDSVTIVNTSADTVLGGAGNDTIAAGGGDDSIDGGDGNDSLSGGAGAGDILLGGAGNDVLRDGDGTARVDAGSGDDSMAIDFKLASADPAAPRILVGGAGADTIAITSTLSDARLVIYGDDSVAGSDDGSDAITLSGTYAVADVVLGGGNDSYQGENSGGTGTTTLIVDKVRGGAGDDTIRGGGGDDLLYGDDGADKLYGGFGNDTLYGGAGLDDLYGNGGDDVVYGEAGNDTLRGFDGNDTLWGGDGDDSLFGENGNDLLYGGIGSDVITGDAGADTIDGGAGLFDKLDGGLANDEITDLDGASEVYGGAGTDKLTLTYTDDGGQADLTRIVSGGDGIDTITMTSNDADLRFAIDGDDMTDEAGDNVDTVTLTGTYAYAKVRLGAGNDSFVADMTDTATGRADDVAAGSGNDMVKTGGGNDTVDGGGGDDTIYGGGGKDSILGGDGTDKLYGEAGNDTIDGGLGLFDVIDGGAGVDVITDTDGAMSIIGDTGNDTVTATYTDDGGVLDVRKVYGGDGLDALTLNSADADLSFAIYGDGESEAAGDKADLVRMNGTYLKAEAYLGGGNDDYQGDNGGAGGGRVDVVWGGTGDDRIGLGGGDDIAHGEDGNDGLYGGDGNDVLYGEAGNDVLNGNLGNDAAYGGEGNDTLWGQDGTDSLDGGDGDDVFYGGDGDDLLFGGTGNDTFTGGVGVDTYTIRKGDGLDRIQDMAVAQDKIDLTDFHFASKAAVKALAMDTTEGVVIKLDEGQQLLLSGLTAKQLTDAMFII